ncbi:MAG: DUF899 domain-containing protein [Piscinibacter sp.]|nr:DUF899 domain-containing protein [Piscinibacter sp.]
MNPSPTSATHPVVPREQWLARRLELLAHEKELTRQADRLARERRALPWVRLDTRYVFDTLDGPRALDELFDGRRQLLVQHFMFAPGWEQGCKSCSFMADHHAGALPHLAQRDVALLVVSRAPLAEIERFRRRMGWPFRWVSSHGSAFNHDFGVSFDPGQVARGSVPYNYTMQAFPQAEAPGISVFWRDDDGSVFHTYSSYGRGVEVMMGTYPLLDLLPKGRDEERLAYGMEWVRHHDRYEAPARAPVAGGCCAA